MNSQASLDARRSALSGLIDYAGLFPPASLDMADAVAGYRAARTHNASWMVHRFICPAGRLGELADECASVGKYDTRKHTRRDDPWPISLLATASDDWVRSAEGDGEAVAAFREAVGSGAYVDAVESQIPERLAGAEELGGEIGQVVQAMGGLGPMFFEVHRGPNWSYTLPSDLTAISGARDAVGESLGAKLRCGGETATNFPSPAQVAEFIVSCVRLGLPFKATAGLHKPFRHLDATTGLTRHGFINLLAATALASVHGLSVDEVGDIVADMEPGNFSLSEGGLEWGSMQVGSTTLRAVRRGLFTGYGSCDFDEPADDLAAIGVLPVGART